MNEKTKSIYNVMQDIFKNVWEQQKYSEIKNSILLTLNLAIFAIIIRGYLSFGNVLQSNEINKYIFYGLILFFILHIVLILHSFFPRDSRKEDMKLSIDDSNMFFYGDIHKLTSSRYLDLVLKTLDENGEVNKQLLLSLSNQIVKLSEITQTKYNSFKESVYRMYILGFIFTAYYSYLFFTTQG